MLPGFDAAPLRREFKRLMQRAFAVYSATEKAALRLLVGAASSGANTDITSLSSSVGTRTQIDGLTLSMTGSSATMSIAAGFAMDSTKTSPMVLASAYTKTGAAWVVGTGNGGKFQAGAIANSTSYHWYEVRRPDTGVVDIGFSTNASGLSADDYVAGGGNLSAAYTQYRLTGSRKTDSSGNWVKVIQRGDLNLLDAWGADANANAPTAATLLTTSVPSGRELEGIFQIGGNPAAAMTLLASSPLISDQAPTQATANFIGAGAFTQQTIANIFTNTSAQVRIRATSANNYIFATIGWLDRRGRD